MPTSNGTLSLAICVVMLGLAVPMISGCDQSPGTTYSGGGGSRSAVGSGGAGGGASTGVVPDANGSEGSIDAAPDAEPCTPGGKCLNADGVCETSWLISVTVTLSCRCGAIGNSPELTWWCPM
jgi:hypothetical protein